MTVNAQTTTYTGPGSRQTDLAHQPTKTVPAFVERRPIRLVFKLFGVHVPTSAQLEGFRKQIKVCDPPADNFVAAMRETGSRIGRAQFEQALEHGLETVTDPMPELVAYFEALEDVPFWVEYELMEKAARTIARVPMRDLLLLTSSLSFPMSYVGARVNEVLLRGGDLDRRAGARVVETVAWFVHCTSPGGMQRFGEGFKSTARIRLIHAYIRSGLNQLDDWDVEVMGHPVNQVHQTVTMIPITGVALLTQLLGYGQTRRERAAVMHLFRYMSHLMGVVPALQVTSIRELLRLTWLAIWSELDPDESTVQLTGAVHRAIPQIHNLDNGRGYYARLTRRTVTRVHTDLSRLALGRDYSDNAKIPRLSPLLAALPLYVAFNAVSNIARRHAPDPRGRVTHRRQAQRIAEIKEISTLVNARAFERDDAVSAIKRRDDQLRAT